MLLDLNIFIFNFTQFAIVQNLILKTQHICILAVSILIRKLLLISRANCTNVKIDFQLNKFEL